MMFIKAAPNSHGFVNPRSSRRSGATSSTGSIASTTTPYSPSPSIPTSRGKPQNLLMLERLYDYISRKQGVRFATFEEIADDFAKRYPRGGSARPVS